MILYVHTRKIKQKSSCRVADMSFVISGIDDLIKDLEKAGKLDAYAPDLLTAAAPYLVDSVKEEVQKAADRGYSEGALAESISANKPAKNVYGNYISVTAKGKDKRGIRNNEKLAYLNYGTSKQSARPVIAKAVQKAENDCLDAMQRKFDEVVKL